MSFAKKMRKNVGKNTSKILSSKSSQKVFDHAEQPVTDALTTTSKIVFKKISKSTGDLNGNKITEKWTRQRNT